MKIFWGVFTICSIIGLVGFGSGWMSSKSENYDTRLSSWIGYAIFIVCMLIDAFMLLSLLIGWLIWH